MTNRYWEYPPSMATLISLIQQGLLVAPPYLVETWQGPVIDLGVWQKMDPGPLGAARNWAKGSTGGFLEVVAAPNAGETAALDSVQQWSVAPSGYGPNRIIRAANLEFVMSLWPLADIDNTWAFFGFSPVIFTGRAQANIAGFGLVGAGNALQTVTDNAGVETVNTGFGETLTNNNKFKVRASSGRIDFYLNEVLIATHLTNLPDIAAYVNLTLLAAGGAANIHLSSIRAWHEDSA